MRTIRIIGERESGRERERERRVKKPQGGRRGGRVE
jgi:hypothetical protein